MDKYQLSLYFILLITGISLNVRSIIKKQYITGIVGMIFAAVSIILFILRSEIK